jgi:hypothetical protein
MARDFQERIAAAAPWATFNVHRGRDQPGLPVEKLLLPETIARIRTNYGEFPEAAAAPAPAPAPPRPLRPAWAKSSEELMAKLDLHQRAFEAMPRRVM